MNELTAYLTAGQLSISKLLLANYQTIRMTNDELLVYLQLSDFASQGDHFPDLKAIGQRMNLPASQIYQLVHALIHKKLIKLDSHLNEQNQQTDVYDLTPALNKLAVFTTQQQQLAQQQATASERELVFSQVELALGRPLSPLESEIVANWQDLDHYSPEMIQLAVREAVLNQVYSLKYVDKVLLNWQRQGLDTKEALQAYQEKHPRF